MKSLVIAMLWVALLCTPAHAMKPGERPDQKEAQRHAQLIGSRQARQQPRMERKPVAPQRKVAVQPVRRVEQRTKR